MSTVLEKLKKLEAEAKELRSSAKKEALAAVKGAVAALNSLGFSYGIIEHPAAGGTGPMPWKGGAKKKASKGSKITRQRDPNKLCPICNEPGHDARRHRWDKVKAKKK
jgi:hypothetical protein